MWLFTRYGFYSAVCARQGTGSYSDPVDPGRMAIRSRDRSHLVSLINRFPDVLGSPAVEEFAGSDYQYRIFTPKSAWEEVCRRLASEIAYDNFKGEVSLTKPDDRRYIQTLHDVWDVVWTLFSRRAYR
jgi:hypothetical protein